MVDFSVRDVAIARLFLLGKNLLGELAIVFRRCSNGVVGEDRCVRWSFGELRVLTDSGLEDQIREPLPHLAHHVLTPVLPPVVAAPKDPRNTNLWVEPLPNHLDVAENLSQTV